MFMKSSSGRGATVREFLPGVRGARCTMTRGKHDCLMPASLPALPYKRTKSCLARLVACRGPGLAYLTAHRLKHRLMPAGGGRSEGRGGGIEVVTAGLVSREGIFKQQKGGRSSRGHVLIHFAAKQMNLLKSSVGDI